MVSFGITTDIGKRKIQQDDLIHTSIWQNEAQLCGIFDGHGAEGHKAAEYARIHFPKILNELKQEIIQDPTKGFQKVFELVNDGMNQDSSLDTYMSGTTASILILYKNFIYCANVGDSRVVLVDKKGIPQALSM